MKVTSVELQVQYISALRSYLAGERETASQDVYELGRKAIAGGLGVLDVLTIHNEALATVLVDKHTAEEYTRVAKEAEDLLMQSLAPFEMTHRGFQEANESLRYLNETLERRIDEQTAELRAREKTLARRARELSAANVELQREGAERMRSEEQLAYTAQYDHLTGLANRALFKDRLEQSLVRTERSGNLMALMCLDLNHFKAVNDTLGHGAGDLLLKEVAERLESSVRKSDTVARMGGDEFSIILDDFAEAQYIAPRAQKVIDYLAQPYVLDGREVFVTTSVGIAVYPSSSRESLIADADNAMYSAKKQKHDAYLFHTPEMNALARERLNTESKLRRALDQEEFLVYYQPKVDLTTGMIVGAEALLRWQDPDSGLISPGKFIPVLEDIGMIGRVGEWVMKTACRQGKAWQSDGFSPLRMAVNISARQFGQQSLIDTVAGALSETGFDPNCLELEVTESLLMEDIESNSRLLSELKTYVGGLQVSIDDFGTGYSSLYYLKTLPIDVLKIDKSFIRDITTDPDDAAITAAIINLAHDLNLKVVAEGVETEGQLAYLRSKACDEAQGYYFSYPLPSNEFTRLLERGGSLLDAGHSIQHSSVGGR
ncbi:MAG TPA: EAL domain-containing protein [Rubrobacteraceae bacterium]|nr:EAL domain-containing protein [Rubrobacteraceae bacterium]